MPARRSTSPRWAPSSSPCDPAGFLWLGLLAVIAAPVGRVIVAAVSYGRDADWTMVAISIAILAVIVVGVVTAVAVTV